MRPIELLNTVTTYEAKLLIKEKFQDIVLESETVNILEAIGRTLAVDIIAPINVPDFPRSTVDGYAVITKDTFGSSETLPSILKNIGHVEMGVEADFELSSGDCCYVPTGGMLPKGSDGVVMIEYTERLGEEIFIYRSVSPGENLLKQGEDIGVGNLLFKKGHLLRPQDIGVLAGVGIIEVEVFEKIKVSIISTGDELIHPTEKLEPGKIKDMNTYSLASALVQKGCEVITRSIVKDEWNQLKEITENCIKKSHIVLISGGSSMGIKDMTKDVINAVGSPGVFIHGVAIKPGKPTIVGRVSNTAVFGLPGQPVSALIVYHILVCFLIDQLYNKESIVPYVEGKIDVNIPSAPGREHYVMVSIEQREDETVISPIYGKSGMLTMMTKASGYIKIDVNQEGINKGETVRTYLF